MMFRRFGSGIAPPEEPGIRLAITAGDGRTSVTIPVALLRWWRTTKLSFSHASEMDLTLMRLRSSAVKMGSRYDNQIVPPQIDFCRKTSAHSTTALPSMPPVSPIRP